MPARSTLSIPDYIRAHCMPEPNTGCWLWTANTVPSGYGQVSLRRFRRRRDGLSSIAHRISYEAFVGPIPSGLDIDHLCRVRCCVNPDHLEPVTRSVNLRRGIGPMLASLRDSKRATCKVGHPLTEDNVIARLDGSRICRLCNRRRDTEYRHRKAARGL